MWLLIDDIRDLNCDVTARTYADGIAALKEYGKKIKCLCIDHDLGESKTGYDVITWAAEHSLLPPHVQIVSDNPVGRENIAKILRHELYTSKNGIDFVRAIV